jgi:hypothetical protein
VAQTLCALPLLACVSLFLAWLLRLPLAERFRAGAARRLAEIAPCLFNPHTFHAHAILEEQDCRVIDGLLDDAEAMLNAHLWLAARKRAGLCHRLAYRPRAHRAHRVRTPEQLLRRWLTLQQRLARADQSSVRMARRLVREPAPALPAPSSQNQAGVTPVRTPHARAALAHLLARALAILRPPDGLTRARQRLAGSAARGRPHICNWETRYRLG